MRSIVKELAGDIVNSIELWRSIHKVTDDELHFVLETVAVHYKRLMEDC